MYDVNKIKFTWMILMKTEMIVQCCGCSVWPDSSVCVCSPCNVTLRSTRLKVSELGFWYYPQEYRKNGLCLWCTEYCIKSFFIKYSA